jgi:hypothetical protein
MSDDRDPQRKSECHDDSLAGAARPFIRRFPSEDELENIDELWVEEARRHLPKEPC